MKKIPFIIFVTLCLPQFSLAATAYFAGGCFWCMESDFEKKAGVSEVVSGFTGGTIANPTYRGNHRGHYEAVEVQYDPNIVSYEELLDYFWRHIDPFDDGGQFCDRGESYRTAVFTANSQERSEARQSKTETQRLFPNQRVVTPILDLKTFYPIKGDESYHQDYYKTNSKRYKYYRWSCGRDKRVKAIWGDK